VWTYCSPISAMPAASGRYGRSRPWPRPMTSPWHPTAPSVPLPWRHACSSISAPPTHSSRNRAWASTTTRERIFSTILLSRPFSGTGTGMFHCRKARGSESQSMKRLFWKKAGKGTTGRTLSGGTPTAQLRNGEEPPGKRNFPGVLSMFFRLNFSPGFQYWENRSIVVLRSIFRRCFFTPITPKISLERTYLKKYSIYIFTDLRKNTSHNKRIILTDTLICIKVTGNEMPIPITADLWIGSGADFFPIQTSRSKTTPRYRINRAG